MKCSLHFPVQPHVLKYLRFRYGPNFVYTNNSSIAPIIRAVLSDPVNSKASKFISDHHYEIILGSYYHNRFKVIYSKEKIFQFNADVDWLFREELYQFMILNRNIYDIKYRTSMRDFLKKLGITEDDIKQETLLKQFGRNYSKKDVSTPQTAG